MDDDLLTVAEFGHVFHGDDRLVDLLLHVHRRGSCRQVLLRLLLVAALGVDYVPASRSVIRAYYPRCWSLFFKERVFIDYFSFCCWGNLRGWFFGSFCNWGFLGGCLLRGCLLFGRCGIVGHIFFDFSDIRVLRGGFSLGHIGFWR